MLLVTYVCVNFNHLIGRCCTIQLCPKSPWVYSLSFAYMQSYDGAPAFAHSLRPRRPAPRPPLMPLVAPPPRVLLPRPRQRLIQQKTALRIHPLSEKSMNPGAIKIIWFERARRTGAVQRICTAPRSIPVEQEQDSVLRKGEMSIQKYI